MSKPFFSIVTVCYNSKKTIGDTLKSVAEQSCFDYEHVVIDGGSTDGTGEVVAQFPEVRFSSEPDKGIYDAMNKGIAASAGEFIVVLNADDFLANKEVLARVKEKLDQSGADCLYADLDYVDAQNPTRVVRHWVSGKFTPGAFKRGWMPPHPTFVLRKACYEKWGVYRTDFRISADYELMLRMLLVRRVAAIYLPKVTVKMRAGGVSNASFAHRLLANREDRKAWFVNGLQIPFYTSWLKPLRKVSQFFKR